MMKTPYLMFQSNANGGATTDEETSKPVVDIGDVEIVLPKGWGANGRPKGGGGDEDKELAPRRPPRNTQREGEEEEKTRRKLASFVV